MALPVWRRSGLVEQVEKWTKRFWQVVRRLAFDRTLPPQKR